MTSPIRGFESPKVYETTTSEQPSETPRRGADLEGKANEVGVAAILFPPETAQRTKQHKRNVEALNASSRSEATDKSIAESSGSEDEDNGAQRLAFQIFLDRRPRVVTFPPRQQYTQQDMEREIEKFRRFYGVGERASERIAAENYNKNYSPYPPDFLVSKPKRRS